MEQLIYIAFGWLLGLLAPSIVRRIERVYRADELRTAITAELEELQHKMTFVAYKLRDATGQLTDKWLAWFEPLVHTYRGSQPTEAILDLVMRLKTLPEEDRFHFLHPDGRANKAVGLMEYSVPLLAAHIGDISIFPMEFQFAALQVKDQLTMFNQRVVFLQRQLERSFDASLSNENHATVRSNLEQGYRELADSAQFIADLVCHIPKQTRKSLARQRKR